MFKVIYHHLAVKDDILKLSSVWKKNIRRAIETKLTTNPEIYGKPLRRSLRNYRKLRVGDYRIIFRIEGDFVKILVIKHRSEVYSVVEKRLTRR
ncbi:MAG: type II toxin-antitoxin system RelE/ParE family toxin [Parcubacteria group bacterium]|nr:type II toxin-antitoxin system RelE/ParE family toxin [Parcubacteria group bacterium]